MIFKCSDKINIDSQHLGSFAASAGNLPSPPQRCQIQCIIGHSEIVDFGSRDTPLGPLPSARSLPQRGDFPIPFQMMDSNVEELGIISKYFWGPDNLSRRACHFAESCW